MGEKNKESKDNRTRGSVGQKDERTPYRSPRENPLNVHKKKKEVGPQSNRGGGGGGGVGVPVPLPAKGGWTEGMKKRRDQEIKNDRGAEKKSKRNGPPPYHHNRIPANPAPKSRDPCVWNQPLNRKKKKNTPSTAVQQRVSDLHRTRKSMKSGVVGAGGNGSDRRRERKAEKGKKKKVL